MCRWVPRATCGPSCSAFGFVGLALFLLFILGTVVAGARVKTAAGYWLHSLAGG